ncbi:MAG: helix-turn-helix transcriptional regulator [Armatimonadetes bacterium]|nr:helix-turn-helix transcriptional regulator [Armatimonadota bacterium]
MASGVTIRWYEPGTKMPWHADGHDHASFLIQGSLLEESPTGSFLAMIGAAVSKPATAVHCTTIGPHGATVASFPLSETAKPDYLWQAMDPSASLIAAVPRLLDGASPTVQWAQPVGIKPHRLLHIAEKNLRKDPRHSLCSLALSVGVDPTYLSALFRRHTGTTFVQRRTYYRLAVSTNAMSTGATLGQAAQAGHFADQAHFTRAFQRQFGVSPKEYQLAVHRIFTNLFKP